MKKIIGILSIFCLVFLTFFSTDSLVKKNTDISLANLVTNANANGEDWWDYCFYCPDPTPYGSVAVPTADLCYDLLQDENDPSVYTYYAYRGYGTDCEDAQTMGPSYCEPESACDEDGGVIYT